MIQKLLILIFLIQYSIAAIRQNRQQPEQIHLSYGGLLLLTFFFG